MTFVTPLYYSSEFPGSSRLYSQLQKLKPSYN